MATQYGEEFVELVHQYYLENSLSFRQLALQSESIFGREFNYTTLKAWAESGDWQYEKHQLSLEQAGTRVEQIEQILDQAYALLTSPEVVSNPKDWAAIANTYFGGLQKVGGVEKKSAKTDLQQVLEQIGQEDADTSSTVEGASTGDH